MFCSFQLFGIRRMTSMANRHNMSDQNREQLNTLNIAPYIQLVYPLIDKQRRMGGNAFRHCLETFSILLDYGIVDHILLKASVIHDLIEDEDGFVEPFGTLTTNVIDAILGKNEIIIKDWSENVEFAEACFATGLFENTGRTISTGHVEAPVWRIKGE